MVSPEVTESDLELLHGDAFKKGTTQTVPPPPAFAVVKSKFSLIFVRRNFISCARATASCDVPRSGTPRPAATGAARRTHHPTVIPEGDDATTVLGSGTTPTPSAAPNQIGEGG